MPPSVEASPSGHAGIRAAEPPHRPVAASAIRAYDVRGTYGRDIDEHGAYSLGLSYADRARAAGLRRVGVGRDGRLSSPGLEGALVRGLYDGGLSVTRIGLGPTPMLGFAVRRLDLDGAIMVTASHNPPAENGFKVLLGDVRVHGRPLRALVETAGRRASGGSVHWRRIADAYVADLAAAAEGMAALNVVWDCGNGATGGVVERLAPRLPGRHRVLNGVVDGRFPAHHPDPAVAANLEQLGEAVRADGADLGVAFDGDGDRLGVVDAEGRVLWADQLLLLLARDLLDRRPGATVVADVKCSKLLFEGVRAAGGRPVLSPSGYVLVREAMQAQDALLGGELSGHIFFAETGLVDDALYAAIRTFQALGRLPGGLGAFRDSLPASFATPELRLACPEPRKHQVVLEVAGRLASDGGVFDPALGLRVERDGGWWLLRASGTEPKLTCRCEAGHPDALDRLRAELAAQLALSGIQAEV
ncbi:MAG TPA: phosphomannomutase/phosphoglucomutase [Phenylobacterium sp.]|jgi:phosphomannomutase